MGKYDIGNKFVTKEGYEIEIIEKYVGIDKSKIIFKESGLEMIVFNGGIRRGTIHNPSHILDKCKVGTIHLSSDGDKYEVIEKIDNNKRLIRFEGYTQTKEVFTSAILSNSVKNNFKPILYGVAYKGEGTAPRSNALQYTTWRNMITRCFSEEYKLKNPTYKNVTVCEDWLDFGKFQIWHNETFLGEGFEIDKDLLQQDVENKIYSPETCIWLPKKVNSFLTNMQRSNTSGYVGVRKHYRKWTSSISIDGVRHHLGYYDTLEEASKSYQEARSIQAEKVKSYMRSLGYYSEEIIQLIK